MTNILILLLINVMATVSFDVNPNINATLRRYATEDENREENQVINSRTKPEWMVTLGRDTYGLSLTPYNYPNLRLKSMNVFYDKQEKPLYITVHDDMDNLNLIGNSMPISLERLKEKMREKFELGQILIEACASIRPDGKLMMNTLWAENPEADSDLFIFDGDEKNPEKFLSPTSLPISLCGFRYKGKDQYLLVTVRPKRRVEMQVSQVKLLFNKPLNECLKEDKELAGQFFVAQKFTIHYSGDILKCSAIYWNQHGAAHRITVTNNTVLKDHMEKRENFTKYNSLTPKSVSIANNSMVILWSNLPIWPFPSAPSLLTYDRPIPFQYISGMNMELPTDLLSYLNNRVVTFMEKLDIPGLSLALAKNELLKLAVSFGYSDVMKKITLTPDDKIRIGSISKTITSTGIFLLVESGDLGIDERVFGFAGIFGMDMAVNDSYPRYVDEITVRHLLSHTVGAWSNVGDDPVFKSEKTSVTEMIRETISKHPLTKPPGLEYQYSNVGYAILGKVIEYRSGMPYNEFINRRIFIPIGLGRQMTLSGRFRAPPEGSVLYYATPDSPDDPYDLPHPSVLEACCGWVLSPSATVKFLTHVDGFPLKKDIIRLESFYQMGSPTRQSNYTYGFGWSINERGFNGRSHQGQMPSSLSFLVRTDSGIELAISMNRYPQRFIGDTELAYLAHHITSVFEGPDLNGIDHFMDNEVVVF
ncbi:unnamed protein product [Bursaphelenchus xylophilus]|uniref:(pine wood nematode) hypothetical protein n=1 Tax=Bursaphelenchus xylophilus TaxID=6326 RepID=A0A1I7RI95_BURXY|nr:unnamed protein product [Bursaphelenchus xylophilus]CAG9115066.1 unnamed protein product [Bursaphelenchus xylophilus]